MVLSESQDYRAGYPRVGMHNGQMTVMHNEERRATILRQQRSEHNNSQCPLLCLVEQHSESLWVSMLVPHHPTSISTLYLLLGRAGNINMLATVALWRGDRRHNELSDILRMSRGYKLLCCYQRNLQNHFLKWPQVSGMTMVDWGGICSENYK